MFAKFVVATGISAGIITAAAGVSAADAIPNHGPYGSQAQCEKGITDQGGSLQQWKCTEVNHGGTAEDHWDIDPANAG